MESKTAEALTKMRTYNIYFDGACLPRNPGGHMGAGFYIDDNHGNIILEGSYYVEANDANTNNVAEYIAIIEALKALRTYLTEERIRNKINLFIYGDSMLVIRQLNGQWKVNGGLYTEYALEAIKLLKEFRPQVIYQYIKWIKREDNEKADEYSRIELGKRGFFRDPRFKHIQR